MKDTTIAAALNKYVDSKFFPIGVILHAFEQDRMTHAQKHLLVHCLNVIRKNSARMEKAIRIPNNITQVSYIYSDALFHCKELEALIERLSTDVPKEL